MYWLASEDCTPWLKQEQQCCKTWEYLHPFAHHGFGAGVSQRAVIQANLPDGQQDEFIPSIWRLQSSQPKDNNFIACLNCLWDT